MYLFNKQIFCKICKLDMALITEDDKFDYSNFVCGACNQPERLNPEDQERQQALDELTKQSEELGLYDMR